MNNVIIAESSKNTNDQLLKYYNRQKKSNSQIIACEKEISQEIIREIRKHGCFYEITAGGIEPNIEFRDFFEGFEKYMRFKEISVYVGEINLNKIQQTGSVFEKMVEKLIEIENCIAKISKEKCQKVYMIHTGCLDMSTISNFAKNCLYDCKLTEKVIFIGIPK